MPDVNVWLAVGIPTVGRAAILNETLHVLALQMHAPDAIIVCGTKPADLEGVGATAPGTVQLLSEAGLPRQRNAISTPRPMPTCSYSSTMIFCPKKIISPRSSPA